MNFKGAIAVSMLAVMPIVSGCQSDSRQQILSMDKTQVALRSVQSRMFDTGDTKLMIRNIIATLQDLGFTVDKVDQTLGLVSATKAGNYLLKMTITTRLKGSEKITVRASAQHNLGAVSDAVPYQQFFDSLSQSLFLDANDAI